MVAQLQHLLLLVLIGPPLMASTSFKVHPSVML